MTALPFRKVEGLGNDFLVVDADAARDIGLTERDVPGLCDRHFGVGADGVLLVDRGEVPRMRVVNADGSRPEMCGNGLRCVALVLALDGDRPYGRRFEVDTDSGMHTCVVHRDVSPARAPSGGVASVEIEMAVPSFDPSRVPVVSDITARCEAAPWRGDAGPRPGELVDAPWTVLGRTLRVTAVSMGNPHVVVFDAFDMREELGTALASDACFPEGVNVGFARMVGPRELDLAVLERGAGWTLACGTGACAAAVAAVETGRAPRHDPLRVRLPGGTLVVWVGDRDQPVRMRGPARVVFDGALRFE